MHAGGPYEKRVSISDFAPPWAASPAADDEDDDENDEPGRG